MGLGFRTNNIYYQFSTQDDKVVTPYRYGTTILPDAGYEVLSQVVLNDVPLITEDNDYGQTKIIAQQQIPVITNGMEENNGN